MPITENELNAIEKALFPAFRKATKEEQAPIVGPPARFSALPRNGLVEPLTNVKKNKQRIVWQWADAYLQEVEKIPDAAILTQGVRAAIAKVRAAITNLNSRVDHLGVLAATHAQYHDDWNLNFRSNYILASILVRSNVQRVMVRTLKEACAGGVPLERIRATADRFRLNEWWPEILEACNPTRPRKNDPPELGRLDDQTVTEGSHLAFTLTASDRNQDPLRFSATGLWS